MTKSVLLIEDDDGDALLARRMFEKLNAEEGAQITISMLRARHGQEAIDSLFDGGSLKGPTPDLILLDIRMPVMDGFEFLEEFSKKSNSRIIPIVILTTSDSHSEIRKAYEMGAHGYVVKPLQRGAFKSLIRAVSGFWLVSNQVVK
jgi:two-component system response regulator